MSDKAALPLNAAIGDYDRQATALFAALQADNDGAIWKFKWEHPQFRGKLPADVRAATLGIDDARLVVARSYGFEGWDDVERFAAAVQQGGPIRRFEEAVEAVIAGDVGKLRAMLQEQPELVRARSARRHHATLLHYVAANGVEGMRQKTPGNAVEVARVLLDAGAEVDALADMYDQKCTTMSMLVSSCHPANAGVQAELAELLVDHGAKLDGGPGTEWRSAVMTALQFGYLETAKRLAERGGMPENVAAAAGLGRLKDVERLLPGADEKSRHAALALAAQHGQAEVVRVLLETGENPNRFNPEGHHAHSTPLHQAALVGHLEVVRLLVERGARLDVEDKIYQATPLGWAEHGGQKETAEYLRGADAKLE